MAALSLFSYNSCDQLDNYKLVRSYWDMAILIFLGFYIILHFFYNDQSQFKLISNEVQINFSVAEPVKPKLFGNLDPEGSLEDARMKKS